MNPLIVLIKPLKKFLIPLCGAIIISFSARRMSGKITVNKELIKINYNRSGSAVR